MSNIKRFKFTKNLYLTLININDAKYILKLRCNNNLSQFLNKTSSSLKLQKKWIKDYLKKNYIGEEYYFKFQIKKKKKFQNIGLARVINLSDKKFHFGSWIIEDGFEKFLSIESIFSVYEFAFIKMKFQINKMWIHKKNKKVILMHEMLGAKKEYTDSKQIYYKFSSNKYKIVKKKFSYFFK